MMMIFMIRAETTKTAECFPHKIAMVLKTNLIRPIAVPTPMAETVDTSTARSPRWDTHLSVRNSPGD